MPPNNQFPQQFPQSAQPTVPQTNPVAQPVPTGSTATQQPAQAPVIKNLSSSQNSLLLSEIRENMVIMSDGSFRAVVACRSINFDLMSKVEQEGVEYAYQNFLNSLTHPVQILIRSQRIDIAPYIDRLSETRRNQDNMLLGILMDDYIDFIDNLSQEANIMDKSFYIVIPYYPAGGPSNLLEQGKGFFDKFFSKPKNTITKIDAATWQKAKDETANRVNGVISGLYQMGIQAVQLDTQQLGSLYYNSYNPDTAVRQPLGSFMDITSTYIKKGGTPTANTTVPGVTQS